MEKHWFNVYLRCIQSLWEIRELISEPNGTSTWNIQGRQQNKNSASIFETIRWTFPIFYSFRWPVIVWFSCHDTVLILQRGNVQRGTKKEKKNWSQWGVHIFRVRFCCRFRCLYLFCANLETLIYKLSLGYLCRLIYKQTGRHYWRHVSKC